MTGVVDFNQQATTVELDYGAFVGAHAVAGVSPIDEFYAARDWAISCANSAPFLGSKAHLQLLTPHLFSSAESYFRRVLAGCIHICPVSAEAASTQVVPIGAALIYKSADLGLVIKDTVGLTSSGEVSSRTSKLLGVNFKQNSSVDVALRKFDQACHVRHAIVHTGGELLYNNRNELGVSMAGRCSLSMNDLAFQGLAQTIVNAVRAYNSYVPNVLIERWFDRNVLTMKWPQDRRRMETLWALFSSDKDACPKVTAREHYDVLRKLRKR